MARRSVAVQVLALICVSTGFSTEALGQIALSQMPPWTGGRYFIRGDADGDGDVTITDPIFTLQYLFRRGDEPPCPAAADSNDDERIDITDAIQTLFVLFGGERMPRPYPQAGPDPTPGLPCGLQESPPARGEQAPRQKGWKPAEGQSYVRLDLRLSGAVIEVAKARVLVGALPATDVVSGDFVYEICDGAGECIALGTMDDPAEERGTRGGVRGDGEADHYFGSTRAASFSIKLPNDRLLSRALSGEQFRLYRRNGRTAAIDTLTAEMLPDLRRGGLDLAGETPVGEVARLLVPALEAFDRDGPEDITTVPPVALQGAVQPLLLNGPTSEKKNLVVLGDGFSVSEQDDFDTLVDNLIIKGAFGSDVFHETASAFNIFKLNALSVDSGVTQAKHTLYHSINVVNPEAFNLNPGFIAVNIPSVGGAVVPVTLGNRSLAKVGEALAALEFAGTDECGASVVHKLNVRMVLEKGDLDGDGDEEDYGYLKVGAPAGLPGPDGEFTIVYLPQGGPIIGIPLAFPKQRNGSIVEKDTAFGYIFTDDWDYCWMQSTCKGLIARGAVLNLVPDWDYVIIILNESDGGGCGGGGIQVFTSGESVGTVTHELGHGIGGLGDEYTKSRKYTGDRPKSPNLDDTTDRTQIKWKDFIRPSTPLPTTAGGLIDPVHEAGAFEGGGSYSKDIYRPVSSCRMKNDSNPFCPICYTHIRAKLFPYQGVNFVNCYTGDFNGDGKDDLVQHAGTMLALFLSDGAKLVPAFFASEHIPSGGWRIRGRDRYYVADMNGDGKDDLYVFNGEDWDEEYLGVLRSTGDGFVWAARYDDAMPNWDFKYRDGFQVGDFDGDGDEDLYIYNLKDWNPEYLGMLRSSGGGLTLIARYDDAVPGWDMGNFDRFLAADFNEDGKVDLYVQNTLDWGSKFVGMLRSSGGSLANLIVYENSLAGWEMGEHDTLHAADFNGDGKKDLYVQNTLDWNNRYLGMFRSNGSTLTFLELYTDEIPGWQMRKWDRFHVADVNGDGREDLYVQNVHDWPFEYVGLLRSTGNALAGHFHEQVIGKWELGDSDWLLPADFSGDGKSDLIIRTAWWLGLFRSTGTALEFKRRYFHWIHNYLFHGPLGHDTIGGIQG